MNSSMYCSRHIRKNNFSHGTYLEICSAAPCCDLPETCAGCIFGFLWWICDFLAFSKFICCKNWTRSPFVIFLASIGFVYFFILYKILMLIWLFDNHLLWSLKLFRHFFNKIVFLLRTWLLIIMRNSLSWCHGLFIHKSWFCSRVLIHSKFGTMEHSVKYELFLLTFPMQLIHFQWQKNESNY